MPLDKTTLSLRMSSSTLPRSCQCCYFQRNSAPDLRGLFFLARTMRVGLDQVPLFVLRLHHQRPCLRDGKLFEKVLYISSSRPGPRPRQDGSTRGALFGLAGASSRGLIRAHALLLLAEEGAHLPSTRQNARQRERGSKANSKLIFLSLPSHGYTKVPGTYLCPVLTF